AFFETCDDVLERNGLLVLQTIAIPENRHARLLRRPDFIQKHVFPGSQLPSVASITGALSNTALSVQTLDEIGSHYVETLRRWRTRFLARREEALSLGYSERFLRLWEYYFAYCEGGFFARYVKDVQMVLVRPGPCFERGRGVK
ncbi:MAG TPA: class I SAM-dependent methyltransferase, partial [Thermoanaerobaculia bacterium]|nr:class I SAM-dependent methyltransferase [Thermoanaerobaculia bacterium]